MSEVVGGWAEVVRRLPDGDRHGGRGVAEKGKGREAGAGRRI